MIVCFIAGSRPKTLYYATGFAIDKTMINLLKNAYAYPRPYLVFDDIEPYSCSKEYGNPSGHSSAAMLMAIMLFLDQYHGKSLYQLLGRRSVQNEQTPLFYLCYSLSLLAALTWASLIPFARVYLGAHSID